MSTLSKPALFLDRDGIINIDHGYVYQSSQFEFVTGIFDVVRAAHQAGFLIVIITNQSGIGRGYYNEDQFHTLMGWVSQQFQEHEGAIDAVYFCPHHPTEGISTYRQNCLCRKPKPGMIKQAATEHNIDLSRSVLIGDSWSDIQAGATAGIAQLIWMSDEASPDINIAFKQIETLDQLDLTHLFSLS